LVPQSKGLREVVEGVQDLHERGVRVGRCNHLVWGVYIHKRKRIYSEKKVKGKERQADKVKSVCQTKKASKRKSRQTPKNIFVVVGKRNGRLKGSLKTKTKSI